jgi:hypothetical protein
MYAAVAASACGEWWRLLLLVVVVPAGCLCRVDRHVLLVQLLRVLAALPSSLSFSVDAAGRRRSTALADATVATRCRRSLPTQTPPLLAAGARHRRRRRHRPLALASDHHVPGCLARGSASHPRRAASSSPAGCSDSALRDSEMTQIETWNYFVGTWKRHRGSSE